jgi:hypothetical protein
VVLPDGTANERRPSNNGRGAIFVVAGLVIVAGFFVLGALSAPGPGAVEAAPTTSTTTTTSLAVIEPPIDLENFTVDQLARGEPFIWESSLNVVDGFPLALLEYEGSQYLFATDVPNFSSFVSGGLRAWRSNDGLAWEPMGQVIDQSHRIVTVSSTGQGLVAMETGPGNGGFTVWQSESGEVWESNEIALDNVTDVMTVFPNAVGGTSRLLIVAGQIEVDIFPLLEEKLGEMAHFGWGTDVIGDQVRITLYGPFGMPLAGVSAEDLSLSEKETQMIVDAFSSQNDQGVDLWVKDGDSEWQHTSLPDAQWVESITTTPYGDAIAHGWGAFGSDSWTTRNGFDWEETTFVTRHYLNQRWEDALVAPSSDGRLSIYVSSEGAEWVDIGPAEHFPPPIQWWFGAVAAGPGGVAATIDGWDERQVTEPTLSPDPPILTTEDARLTIDFNSGEYRLEKDREVHTWSTMSGAPNDVDIDLESATVNFLDPESGRPLASFAIEDIIGAQEDYIAASDPESTGYGAIAFTGDGNDWTIQSQGDMGSGRTITQLAVTDTHIVATAVDVDSYYNPSSPPGFNVWTAPIP